MKHPLAKIPQGGPANLKLFTYLCPQACNCFGTRQEEDSNGEMPQEEWCPQTCNCPWEELGIESRTNPGVWLRRDSDRCMPQVSVAYDWSQQKWCVPTGKATSFCNYTATHPR